MTAERKHMQDMMTDLDTLDRLFTASLISLADLNAAYRETVEKHFPRAAQMLALMDARSKSDSQP